MSGSATSQEELDGQVEEWAKGRMGEKSGNKSRRGQAEGVGDDDKGSKDCRSWKGNAVSGVAAFRLAAATVPMGRFRGFPSNRRLGELLGDLCSAATHMRDTHRPVS